MRSSYSIKIQQQRFIKEDKFDTSNCSDISKENKSTEQSLSQIQIPFDVSITNYPRAQSPYILPSFKCSLSFFTNACNNPWACPSFISNVSVLSLFFSFKHFFVSLFPSGSNERMQRNSELWFSGGLLLETAGQMNDSLLRLFPLWRNLESDSRTFFRNRF